MWQGSTKDGYILRLTGSGLAKIVSNLKQTGLDNLVQSNMNGSLQGAVVRSLAQIVNHATALGTVSSQAFGRNLQAFTAIGKTRQYQILTTPIDSKQSEIFFVRSRPIQQLQNEFEYEGEYESEYEGEHEGEYEVMRAIGRQGPKKRSGRSRRKQRRVQQGHQPPQPSKATHSSNKVRKHKQPGQSKLPEPVRKKLKEINQNPQSGQKGPVQLKDGTITNHYEGGSKKLRIFGHPDPAQPNRFRYVGYGEHTGPDSTNRQYRVYRRDGRQETARGKW